MQDGAPFENEQEMSHFSFSLKLQCALWTILHTLKAKYTFRAILSFTGIIRNINIHWTHFFAFAARYTFAFITLNPEQ